MCQLIFANTNNVDLNRLIVFNLMLEDSRLINRDGWGIFQPGAKALRFHIEPELTLDFGLTVKNCVRTALPVIAHVRAATKGTAVKTEFNHPFVTNDLILAHNGTLEQDVINPDYANILDSEIFLLELQAVYEQNRRRKNNLFTSVNETMQKFTGKFAFLIYEKSTKRFYAFRGKTADLHWVDITQNGEIIGYVVNTNKEDLKIGMSRAIELAKLMLNLEVGMSKPELLKENTGYLLENCGITELGKVEQREKPLPQSAAIIHRPAERPWYLNADYWADDTTTNRDAIYPQTKDIDAILRVMRLYGLTLEDIDDLLLYVCGTGILSCIEGDIKTLLEIVVPKLQCPKSYREDVLKVKGGCSYEFMQEIYAKGSFQFPYMLEKNGKKFINAIESARIKLFTT